MTSGQLFKTTTLEYGLVHALTAPQEINLAIYQRNLLFNGSHGMNSTQGDQSHLFAPVHTVLANFMMFGTCLLFTQSGNGTDLSATVHPPWPNSREGAVSPPKLEAKRNAQNG